MRFETVDECFQYFDWLREEGIPFFSLSYETIEERMNPYAEEKPTIRKAWSEYGHLLYARVMGRVN